MEEKNLGEMSWEECMAAAKQNAKTCGFFAKKRNTKFEKECLQDLLKGILSADSFDGLEEQFDDLAADAALEDEEKASISQLKEKAFNGNTEKDRLAGKLGLFEIVEKLKAKYAA